MLNYVSRGSNSGPTTPYCRKSILFVCSRFYTLWAHAFLIQTKKMYHINQTRRERNNFLFLIVSGNLLIILETRIIIDVFAFVYYRVPSTAIE